MYTKDTITFNLGGWQMVGIRDPEGDKIAVVRAVEADALLSHLNRGAS